MLKINSLYGIGKLTVFQKNSRIFTDKNENNKNIITDFLIYIYNFLQVTVSSVLKMTSE